MRMKLSDRIKESHTNRCRGKSGRSLRAGVLLTVLLLCVCMAGCAGHAGNETAGDAQTAGEGTEQQTGQGSSQTIEQDGQTSQGSAVQKIRTATPLLTDYTTDEMYERATKFSNLDYTRLAGVMRRAEAGEPVTIAALGGSITQGSSATKQENCYASLVYKWWTTTFPDSEITFINAGIGGTDSYLGVHRVQTDVLDYDPDFVIVEYSVNDGNGNTTKQNYDNLVHRILSYETNPAVMLLYMTMEGGICAQETHVFVGFNYKLPQVSYHDAIMPELDSGNISWASISPDNTHPNDRGHAICGELIWRYLNEIYVNLDSYGEPTETVNSFLTKDVYSTAHILDHDSLEVTYSAEYRTLQQADEAEAVTGDAASDTTEYAVEGTGTAGDASGTNAADEKIIGEIAGFSDNCRTWSEFDKGWSTDDGGSISFTVYASRIGILYYKTVTNTYGRATIYVDGVNVRTLDADFGDGWGNYGYAESVYASAEAAEHVVEIFVDPSQERTAFDVLGILVAE